MKFAVPALMAGSLAVSGTMASAAPLVDPGWARQWSIAKAPPSALVGDRSITVAVLDTGISAHPDLGWRIGPDGLGKAGGVVLPGYDFISDPWVALDGDGWDADPTDRGDGVRQADLDGSRPLCKARISSWHGTNVAGTVGAIGENERGITGLASGANVLPVRILGRCGGSTADVAAAVLWASGEPVPGVPENPSPARVINLSLSGASARCPRALQTAIDVARERGATVVVAAGSAGIDTKDETPANCSGVIVVGATDRKGRRSPTSNFGNEVTVSAPGGDMAISEADGIYTTTNKGRFRPRGPGYGYYQGSSAAAAHVSGVIAMLLSRRPTMTPADVELAISSPAVLTPFQPGQCDPGEGLCGAGILQVDKMLQTYPRQA